LRTENKPLRDVMTRGVVTVKLDDTVKEIASMLTRYRLSAVAVIDREGEAMGIISNMDILKVIGKENWEKLLAESIMTSNMETAKPTSTIGDAAKIMREKHIHRLLILSEDGVGASQRPIGILSASDIVKEVAR